MKAVGVKQLKARLSEYVRLVKAGETILVTDRDEVVAELRPAQRQPRVLARCELWELTRAVCDLAGRVAPGMPLRALDALHLATFLLARGRIQGLELVTVGERLRQAAGVA